MPIKGRTMPRPDYVPPRQRDLGNTVTRLYGQEPGGIKRLMNEITFSSSFSSVPLAAIIKQAKAQDDSVTTQSAMSHPLVQLMVARDLRNGWVHNGSRPNAVYTIEQNGEEVR